MKHSKFLKFWTEELKTKQNNNNNNNNKQKECLVFNDWKVTLIFLVSKLRGGSHVMVML